MSRCVWTVCAVVPMFAIGCSPTSAPKPLDTGAKDVVFTFFDAVARRDGSRAHALLSSGSRKRVSADRLSSLVEGYNKLVGFPPETVVVRSCDEQGDRAVAHVAFVGHPGGHRRRYEDGITAVHEGGEWRIDLPPRFGQK